MPEIGRCKYLDWNRCQYALRIPSPAAALCVGYSNCDVYEEVNPAPAEPRERRGAMDRLLTGEEMRRITSSHDRSIDKWRAITKAQDEISFSAGRQEGIGEAVEFCEANQMPDKPASEPYPGLVVISKERWQAQLKKWGKEQPPTESNERDRELDWDIGSEEGA